MEFWQLTVPTSPEISDGLTNFLWEQGALGVIEEESPSEAARLRAFFPAAAHASRLAQSLATYQASLRALGFPVGEAEAEISPLLDGEWASAWQRAFPPREIGRRLVILPPWEADGGNPRARLPVIIDPGRAFGTGQHGTTEGCLVLLEEVLEAGGAGSGAGRVLDIGTGSGILAIAALRLGAGAALAIDVDPDALEAARRNAGRNSCADRIVFGVYGADELPATERFPLVVANLLTHTHLGLAACYARLLTPGGILIAGGILEEEERQVVQALGGEGLGARRRVVIDGWSSLLFDTSRA